MTVPHEEAAKEIHPTARMFRPVKKPFGKNILGWIFQIPKEGRQNILHGWVTADAVASADALDMPYQAERNLKAYVRSHKKGEGTPESGKTHEPAD
ncbi:hypothetical protein ABT282_08175 [Streptomyces sp. NPDC000927]|uniref:hypothetical protein n=1 Tax=Streptomyces sp. NPDC000927 TaxID=3154371 RepID=UPI00332ECAE9